jgi:hypothetical protein
VLPVTLTQNASQIAALYAYPERLSAKRRKSSKRVEEMIGSDQFDRGATAAQTVSITKV